jgi:hypothetical protein
MAENDFLPFAVGESANVVSQDEYAALTTILQGGYTAGIAKSEQVNKTWRQASIMAAVLAQFISDRTGQDAIDDGTITTLLANLKASAAALNGDNTKVFSVAPATQSQHALQAGQALGLYLGTVTFTSSGTYTPGTYTVGGRSVTATKCKARLWAPGGGGQGSLNSSTAGNSGGGGGYTEGTFSASVQTVTIGSPGTGGAAGTSNSGTAGGNSSFGALLTANGGGPGTSTSNGTGGTSAGGYLNSTGQSGQGAISVALGGTGGGSFGSFGGLSHVVSTGGSGGFPAGGGAGGGGGFGGGAGGTSYLIVDEFS